MPEKRAPNEFTEKELQSWKLVSEFQSRLAAVAPEPRGSFADPRRRLSEAGYLSLLLFGLFNPVLASMRGLCAASRLRRVQAEVCAHRVSLGSFSEAQAVVDPELLRQVFVGLAAEAQPFRGDLRLAPYRDAVLGVDSSLWAALPRMQWAVWRWQHGRESAVRAHFKFNLLEEKPVGVILATAKKCERAVLRQSWRAGEFYVGDRYYGEDYRFFAELTAAGCGYVLRLRQEARFTVVEEFAATPEDVAASVTFDGLVRLGARGEGPVVRLVRVAIESGELLLVTGSTQAELGAELVALLYRYRWRVELFFKWLKCILKCRHWLAESPQGVALQIYAALIAALLLVRFCGHRPRKREMELLQFYMNGMATLEEVIEQLGLQKKA